MIKMKYYRTKPAPAVVNYSIALANKGKGVAFKPGATLEAARIDNYLLHADEVASGDMREICATGEWTRNQLSGSDMQVATAKMAQAVRSGISYFRGDCVNDIRTLYARCNEQFAHIVTPSITSEFNIIESSVPEVITEHYNEINLELFEDGIISNSNTSSPMIVKYSSKRCMQGSRGVDDNILRFLAGIDINMDVWEACFNSIFRTRTLDHILQHLGHAEIINSLLPVYLTANAYLSSEGLDGLQSSMDLNDIQASLRTIRKYAGVRLSMAINGARALTKRKMLVIGEDRMNKTIYVDSNNYNKFLRNGGTAESILGRLLDGGSCNELKAMQSKAIEYVGIWKTFVATTRSSTRRERFAVEIDIVSVVATEMIDTKYGLRTDENVGDYSRAESALEKCLAGCDAASWKKDQQNTFLELGCRIFHSGSYAETYLKDVETIAASEPDLTPKEVDFVATMNYISVYLKTQIQLT